MTSPNQALRRARDAVEPVRSEGVLRTSRVAVERAISEFRAGRPVLVQGCPSVFAISAECFDGRSLEWTEYPDPENPRVSLVLTARRLAGLGLGDWDQACGRIDVASTDAASIHMLTSNADARIDRPVLATSQAEAAAVTLARLASLLPAAVCFPSLSLLGAEFEVLSVPLEAIESFRVDDDSLRIVGRAPCPLEEAEEAEFVVFGSATSPRSQVAIIIGNPDPAQSVAVRIHSACLTGDLFGSLRCDCGDQLRGSVRWMAANGGGVLLYLDQEGRGIGLANKIRAYALQMRGLDTFEADEMLGFEGEHRRYEAAAAMIRQLGMSSIRLLTNNPLKTAAMEAAGIAVVETRRVLGRLTAYNVEYLECKRTVTRHLVPERCEAVP